MWLAWRHGACLVPAPRVAGAQRHGPGPVAGVPRHHGGVDGADAGGAVARRGARGGAAADLRRRGLPARTRRAAGAVDGREVWNTYGPTEATVVACLAQLDGVAPGQHRPAAARLGPRRRRQGRQPGRPRRGRRTGDRRRRPGPLPRSGEGRREVRADADAGVVARLPQRRPGPARSRRPLLPGPRRRPGQGRRPPHRTRRGRLGAGEPARRQRRRGRGAPHRQRHSPAGRLHRQRRPRLRPGGGPRRTGRIAARRAGAAAGAASTSCRPGRRARSTATRCRGRSTAAPATTEPGPRRHHGLAGRAVARRARRAGRRARGGLLRPRRRLAVGGAAGGRAARALPAGDRRRPLRPSPARLARRLPRRTRPATAVETRVGEAGVAVDRAGPGRGVGAAGHAHGHAVGGVAGAAQQRRRGGAPGAVGACR